MVMNISGPPWEVSIPAGNALALTSAQVQALLGWALAADGPGFIFFGGRTLLLNGHPIAIV